MSQPGAVVPRVVAAVALALAAPAGLGCGDSKDDKPAATRTTSEAEAALAGRVAEAQRGVRAAPDDPEALKALVLAHIQLALTRGYGADNTITPEGKAELRKAAAAWARYRALVPRTGEPQLASLMARAFGPGGLDEPQEEIRATSMAAQATKPASANLYAQLASVYYSHKRLREGDRAARRATRLSPLNQRTDLRRTLGQIRSRAKKQDP